MVATDNLFNARARSPICDKDEHRPPCFVNCYSSILNFWLLGWLERPKRVGKKKDKKMTTIDIGCGFNSEMGQASIPEAVGLDLNFESGASMVAHPIISDVTRIPLKDECGQFLHAHAILEHLPRADLCLAEMKRIMRPDGQGSILVPVDAHSIRQVLGRFVKEFPFSLGWVLDKLYRSVTLWRIPGLLHVTQVDVKDVERWFKVDRSRVRYNRRLHKWFVHMTPMVVLIKLGVLRTRLTVDEYAEVVIPICRK